jgi:alpha-D-xyloside xylohydrolase
MVNSDFSLQLIDRDYSITTSPFSFRVSDRKSDRPIWGLNAIWFRDLSRNWFNCSNSQLLHHDNQSIKIQLHSNNSEIKITLTAGIVEGRMKIFLNSHPSESVEWIGLDLAAFADEHFLGLGERFDSLDHAGKRVDLSVENGASGGRTYKPIPFYMSSNGYGLHIDTNVRTIIDFATIDHPDDIRIRIADNKAGLNLTFHPTFKRNLLDYTALAGRPALPPAWVFGPWKSRDWTVENQKTALEDIELTRLHHLAGTVKVIDAAWEAQLNNFIFDPEKFPDAKAFIDRCHELGFKLVIWVAPWMVFNDPPSQIYNFCAKNGYLITKPSGEIYVHNLGNSPTFMGSCFDFTNPDAVSWWQKQIKRLVEMGIDGFKTDFGEQVPQDAIFSNGQTGKDIHNIFPAMYNKITYEAMTQIRPGTLFARSAWHGSQAYGAIWAGDQTSDFAPATGLPSVIIAGQSAGVSGFPFWASDIGGYYGIPTEKVFIRWIQFGAFSPIMQIHGLGNREPWNFSEKVLNIYRRFAQIHMDLFPYIYTAAQSAVNFGIPVMRALVIEFQEDPNIWQNRSQHQYLFGDQLLVAPVYSGDDRFSIVYLPKGLWLDFWNGSEYQGGKDVRIPGCLETIPVFAKAGSIIPFLDPSPETLLASPDHNIITAEINLRLQLYPGEDGAFKLHDGTQFIWTQENKMLQISDSPIERQISINIPGSKCKIVSVSSEDNQPLSSYESVQKNRESKLNKINIMQKQNLRIHLLIH